MPVVARFCGIVIRLLRLGQLGVRLHAFFEGREMVVDLATLRTLQENVPLGVRRLVLAWARQHRPELLDRWRPSARGR
jgi:hypothetical protein